MTTGSTDKPARTVPLVGALAGIVVVAILFIGWMRSGDDVPAPEPVAIRYVDSVAVMPLLNGTGEPDFGHIGVGIAEEIIEHLSRIPALKVISRHSAQALAQQALTPVQIGSGAQCWAYRGRRRHD